MTSINATSPAAAPLNTQNQNAAIAAPTAAANQAAPNASRPEDIFVGGRASPTKAQTPRQEEPSCFGHFMERLGTKLFGKSWH